jgi:phosphodiesterase/alkaline phosphatase D-like protein
MGRYARHPWLTRIGEVRSRMSRRQIRFDAVAVRASGLSARAQIFYRFVIANRYFAPGRAADLET